VDDEEEIQTCVFLALLRVSQRERERESEIEAAIEQATSAIAEAPPEGVRSASLRDDQPIRNREAGSPRRS
jgi:hypothetical protein